MTIISTVGVMSNGQSLYDYTNVYPRSIYIVHKKYVISNTNKDKQVSYMAKYNTCTHLEIEHEGFVPRGDLSSVLVHLRLHFRAGPPDPQLQVRVLSADHLLKRKQIGRIRWSET